MSGGAGGLRADFGDEPNTDRASGKTKNFE
ncbi:MAG: hypothetical protein RLZZ398_187 [Verrucomicrobiota bacterium]|jgi:hypothetical protein